MYGTGTRSQLNSPEHHAMNRDRKQATEAWQARSHAGVEVGPFCTCGAARFPHKPHGRGIPNYRWAWSRRP